MIAEMFERCCRFFPKSRGLLWRKFYGRLAESYKKKDWVFMNYGYVSRDENTGEFIQGEHFI